MMISLSAASRGMSRSAGRLLLRAGGVSTLLLCGCYQYSPVELSSVPPDAQVRARLSDREIDRLQLREVFRLEDQTLEGRVLGQSGPSLNLLVPVVGLDGQMIPNGGSAGGRLNQQVLIQGDGLIETRVRHLDVLRTGVVTGLGIAIITSFVMDSLSGWFGGNREILGPDKGGIT